MVGGGRGGGAIKMSSRHSENNVPEMATMSPPPFVLNGEDSSSPGQDFAISKRVTFKVVLLSCDCSSGSCIYIFLAE